MYRLSARTLSARTWRGGRGMDDEGGGGAGRARDGQPAAMAVEDMLDQRQPEAGAALGAAFRNVDPAEPLGEPRQMLGGDPGTIIAHADPRLRLAFRGRPHPEFDIDALAG